MEFDVIDISQEELEKLNSAQMKVLRTAQQKKEKLFRDFDRDNDEYREKLLSAGMVNSSLSSAKLNELYEEFSLQFDVLVDNLVFSLSLLESKEENGGENKDESEASGYLVDYSLSYSQRYVIVRNYYLAIENRDERMAKYGKDEIAKKYLGTYYNTLYNILATYDKQRNAP